MAFVPVSPPEGEVYRIGLVKLLQKIVASFHQAAGPYQHFLIHCITPFVSSVIALYSSSAATWVLTSYRLVSFHRPTMDQLSRKSLFNMRSRSRLLFKPAFASRSSILWDQRSLEKSLS